MAFPSAGMAAMDPETGVISPGGIGFDINCGMRLVADQPYLGRGPAASPRARGSPFSGVSRPGWATALSSCRRTSSAEVAEQGSAGAFERAMPGRKTWNDRRGRMFPGADASKISVRAIERGFDQIGTLGSGNHYCEMQVARPENIFDEEHGPRVRFHPPEPGGHHVSLREQGFRPSGGNRLPGAFSERDGQEVRHLGE